jgi:hypothetical protein
VCLKSQPQIIKNREIEKQYSACRRNFNKIRTSLLCACRVICSYLSCFHFISSSDFHKSLPPWVLLNKTQIFFSHILHKEAKVVGNQKRRTKSDELIRKEKCEIWRHFFMCIPVSYTMLPTRLMSLSLTCFFSKWFLSL